MLKYAVAMALMTVSGVAVAAPQPVPEGVVIEHGPTIWRNLKAGMDRAEVVALYPASDSFDGIHGFELAPGHAGSLYFEYEWGEKVGKWRRKALSVVKFEGRTDKAVAYQALLDKYGQPGDRRDTTTETRGRTGIMALTNGTSHETRSVWFADGLMITYETSEGVEGYDVTYQVKNATGLAAAF